jgi:WD40 repeat protein
VKKRYITLVSFLFILSVSYAQKNKKFTVFNTIDKVISDICFTDKGKVLGITDNNSIKAFWSDSGELLAEFENGHNSRILTIDISKDSTLLVSGGRDSIIIIWDFIGNKILKSLEYHKGIITSVKISPDNRYLLSGGTDNRVFLYDIRKDKVLYELREHKNVITSVVFSSNGELFASSGGDRMINIYSTEEGTLIASLDGHRNWVRCIHFSDDGKRLISCGDDSRVIIWKISDINNINKEIDKRFSAGWLLSADFNEDSQTFSLGDIYGNTLIVGQFARYKARLGGPVNRILFKPGEGSSMIIAVATRGKGAVLINTKNMKYKTT